MWRKYFTFIKLIPGKVVVHGHGTIDFSQDNLSLELVVKLFENDFPYLQITEEGREKFYGIKPKRKRKANTSEKPTRKNRGNKSE